MPNGKSSGTRWLLLMILVAALGGGAWWYFNHADETAPEYQSAEVLRGDVTQAVTSTGTLNPVVNIQVGSQVSGIIKNLYADFNTPVKANQIVAELDPATFKANVAQAEGDLANSKANLELAQVQAKRSTELFKNKLISESEYDTAIASLHQAQAMVQIKTASLENARVTLSRATIYSPVNGVVISRNVDVGQTVAASLSAPVLFQIANDLANMQIDANVAEADVGGILEDQAVNFTVDAFPYRTFHGKVVQVRNAPTTVQNVVTYDTVIGVNNADLKLKPGMTANVSIIIAERTNTLTIPNAALRFRMPDTNSASGASAKGGNRRRRSEGGAPATNPRPRGEKNVRTVYVLPEENDKDDAAVKPKPVQIKIGITDGIVTEVVEGLNEGDRVVTGMTQPVSSASAPASNPFGGGGFPRR
ncbi:MAG: efflux RND transporter periplasmic adaptor subunit [Verrucomicrobiota bacterium]